MGRDSTCVHIAEIRDVRQASRICRRCVTLGDTWVHLRMCMTCGVVGCCDSSTNAHARGHADAAGHPIARSIEPFESWMWCFVDNVSVDGTSEYWQSVKGDAPMVAVDRRLTDRQHRSVRECSLASAACTRTGCGPEGRLRWPERCQVSVRRSG
jgi:hypothetical protein